MPPRRNQGIERRFGLMQFQTSPKLAALMADEMSPESFLEKTGGKEDGVLLANSAPVATPTSAPPGTSVENAIKSRLTNPWGPPGEWLTVGRVKIDYRVSQLGDTEPRSDEEIQFFSGLFYRLHLSSLRHGNTLNSLAAPPRDLLGETEAMRKQRGERNRAVTVAVLPDETPDDDRQLRTIGDIQRRESKINKKLAESVLFRPTQFSILSDPTILTLPRRPTQ